MTPEERLKLIKEVGEEIITEEELAVLTADDQTKDVANSIIEKSSENMYSSRLNNKKETVVEEKSGLIVAGAMDAGRNLTKGIILATAIAVSMVLMAYPKIGKSKTKNKKR